MRPITAKELERIKLAASIEDDSRPSGLKLERYTCETIIEELCINDDCQIKNCSADSNNSCDVTYFTQVDFDHLSTLIPESDRQIQHGCRPIASLVDINNAYIKIITDYDQHHATIYPCYKNEIAQ